MTTTSDRVVCDVTFRLRVNEATARESYETYVGDVNWYRDNNQLLPDNPDPGYRTGVPEPWDEYLAGWIEAIVTEVLDYAKQGGLDDKWWTLELLKKEDVA